MLKYRADIDGLRAIAVLIVLFFHLDLSLFKGGFVGVDVFFTISGLIFTFLLLKAKGKDEEKLRIKKGFKRGLFLIFVGYLIRIPIFQWLSGSFNSYFLVIDVLQCIGLSLILIIFFYIVSAKKIKIFSMLCLCLGILIFLTEPLYRELNFNNCPSLLCNYISKSNGSIFTIIPWFAYVAFGLSLIHI